ncbi:Cytochrome P450 CYP736A12 [Glycine soja]
MATPPASPPSPPRSPLPPVVASASPSTLKRIRKATRLRSLATRPPGAERPVVHIDPAAGKANDSHKKKLRTYLEIVTRDKVNVTYETWKEVPAAQKDLIWEDIQEKFDIPEASDGRTKKKVLQTIGKRWREFKSDLTRKWALTANKDNTRRDPSWEDVQKKAQAIQKHNTAPHMLSRGGYEYLEQKLMVEKTKKKLEEATQFGSTEGVIDPPSPIRRHEKWKMACTKKTGQMTSEATKEIVEKIISHFQLRIDLLTAAIGRPEHPGRVRAAGAGITIKQFFGLAPQTSRSSSSMAPEELEQLTQQIRDQLEESITKNVTRQLIPSCNHRYNHRDLHCLWSLRLVPQLLVSTQRVVVLIPHRPIQTWVTQTNAGCTSKKILLAWLLMQSYLPRALDRRLQEDWAKDAREGPRVPMSLRTHLLLEVASPLSLPSPFRCHTSSKKQRNPLMKKILGLQAPMELTSVTLGRAHLGGEAPSSMAYSLVDGASSHLFSFVFCCISMDLIEAQRSSLHRSPTSKLPSIELRDYYEGRHRSHLRPHSHRREKEIKPQEANINLPYFHGKDNVEANLDWEIRVEQQFTRKSTSKSYGSYSYPKKDQGQGILEVTPSKTKDDKGKTIEKQPLMASMQEKTSSMKCFKCLGKGHITSKCPTKKSMIMRGQDIYSSQDEATTSPSSSETEEPKGEESSEEGQPLMVKEECKEVSVSSKRLVKKESNFEIKTNIKETSHLRQPPHLLLCKKTLVSIATLLGLKVIPQVNELLDEGFVRKSLNPCALLVPKIGVEGRSPRYEEPRDLRSNPFQGGGNDAILPRKGIGGWRLLSPLLLCLSLHLYGGKSPLKDLIEAQRSSLHRSPTSKLLSDSSCLGQDNKVKDFVDVMLGFVGSKEYEYRIEQPNINAILLDMLLGSMDTSATAIEWTLSELLKNPRVMKKVQMELETMVGMQRKVKESDLDKLEYLDMVIKEKMRLHPVAPLLMPHQSREDCMVGDFFIPRKSRVVVNAWAIMRDSSAWSEAEKLLVIEIRTCNLEARDINVD